MPIDTEFSYWLYKNHLEKWDELWELSKEYESEQCNIAFVSKRFIVMYEDGHYYGSFSPLGVWETYEGAEIAENKWKQENPSKQTCIEEVDYNAC